MSDIPNGFYRISSKALILDENKKFLLSKETSGMWELPGGGVDFGEKPQDAIKREIKEEMGLKTTYIADNPSYFFTFRSTNDVPFSNVVYVTEVENLDFTPSDECIEVRFFTKEEALKVKLFGSIKDFLELFSPENH
ncbi:MAG TPA: NUDIX hydrolase [bacterium]|nr:NUDIX hydrolase [bacterium]